VCNRQHRVLDSTHNSCRWHSGPHDTESIVVTEWVPWYHLARSSGEVMVSDGQDLQGVCYLLVSCIRGRRTDLDAERADMTALGLLHLFAVLCILQHRHPPARSQHRCCTIANMPDDIDALADPSSAVGSPDPLNGRKQQAACLSCREAKQKCSKGVPW
jgi:hypothetical protein